jgi:transposase
MNSKVRLRAEVILQVRSGQLSATAAAQQLGISRQQYYQWEQRALTALLEALEDRPTGRPKNPTDTQRQQLQQRVEQLEHQVQHYEQKEKLRQFLNQWADKEDSPPAKKNPP